MNARKAMPFDIRHDPDARRFLIEVDGHVGHVDYARTGETLAITHTIVPPEIGGRGIAAALVRAAVEHARAEGLKIDPQCSYADVWLQRHLEYAGLRA